MLKENVYSLIKEKGMLEDGEKVVLGLSGGPDSLCLFSLLLELGYDVYAVHINHNLRGEDADNDERAVRKICEEKGVPLKIVSFDCNLAAKEYGISTEEAGRDRRYLEFKLESRRLGYAKIALAHNKNDQAETVLFRIIRGTGIDGLAGIEYLRREDEYTFIRPLLDTDRKEIEEYCKEMKLEPCIDRTNSEALYSRNKLRLDLIPKICEEYNSNFPEGLVRLSKAASEEKEYISRIADEAYEYALANQFEIRKLNNELEKRLADNPEYKVKEYFKYEHSKLMSLKRLKSLPLAIRHRLIPMLFKEIGLNQDISFKNLEAADYILENTKGLNSVDFPHGYSFKIAKGMAFASHDTYCDNYESRK